jgi:hypothetical protein
MRKYVTFAIAATLLVLAVVFWSISGDLPELRVRLPHDAQHGFRTIGKRCLSVR